MYTQLPDGIRRDDGAFIPLDPENPDYRVFLGWVAEGNTPALPPEPTHPQLWERAIAEMRLLRQPILVTLDGLQSSALTIASTAEEPEVVEAARERARIIETAKQGLRDITKLNLADCATADEMRTKVGMAYAALVATLPAEIKAAFREATK